MKCGLKTIPLAVDDDDRVKLIEAEYGLKGWAVMYKLYQYIAAHGYYLKWDIDTQLLFIRDKCLSAVGQSAVSEIVTCAIRRGVFDAVMYQKHGILTSNRIQETFLNATKRNTKVVFENEYCLPIVRDFIETASKNGKTVNIFIKNADSFQQKKGKEKKGKENIVVADLTEEAYDELCDTIGKADCDYYIERVKAFLLKHPDAKFSTKATILKWHRADTSSETRPGEEKRTYETDKLNGIFNGLREDEL